MLASHSTSTFMKTQFQKHFSRLGLLKGLASVSLFGILSTTALAALNDAPKLELKKGSIILFQGDSITDAGRRKDNKQANHEKALGKGYVGILAGSLLAEHADLDLKIYNRGISGNKIPDLQKRWQEDTIDLKPDVVSILVGVNDLWHTLGDKASYHGTLEDYEKGYRELIQRTQRELPGVQIIICEAFTSRQSEQFKTLDQYAAVCKKLADEFDLPFVPFHQELKRVIPVAHQDFWLWDGIHPAMPGHALLADTWREATGL